MQSRVVVPSTVRLAQDLRFLQASEQFPLHHLVLQPAVEVFEHLTFVEQQELIRLVAKEVQ